MRRNNNNQASASATTNSVSVFSGGAGAAASRAPVPLSLSLPSNAVLVADIGVHCTKSGIVVGAAGLGYDEENIQRGRGRGAVGGGGAAAVAAAQRKAAAGEPETTVTLVPSKGLSDEYRVVDADAVIRCALGSLITTAKQQRKQQQLLDGTAATAAGTNLNKTTEYLQLDDEDDDAATLLGEQIEALTGTSGSHGAIPGCVALLLPYRMRRGCIEKLLQALFEGHAPPRAFLGCSSVQALAAGGAMTGTVVDVGQFETRVVPVTDGSCHRMYVQRSESLGACQQAAGALSNFLTTSRHGGDQDAREISAVSAALVVKPYMTLSSSRGVAAASTSQHPRLFSRHCSEFCDDLVRLFSQSTTSMASGGAGGGSGGGALLPDGNPVEFGLELGSGGAHHHHHQLQKQHNSSHHHHRLSHVSAVALQDMYADFLFSPQAFAGALNETRQTIPLFNTLLSRGHRSTAAAPFLSDSTLSSLSVPTLLLSVLRSLHGEPMSASSSDALRAAAGTVVLTGGSTVVSNVEAAFARCLEQISIGCKVIKGNSINNNSGKSITQQTAVPDQPVYRPLRDRLNASWVGGSMFVQLPSMVECAVTAKQYYEEGPGGLAHMYGVGGWRGSLVGK